MNTLSLGTLVLGTPGFGTTILGTTSPETPSLVQVSLAWVLPVLGIPSLETYSLDWVPLVWLTPSEYPLVWVPLVWVPLDLSGWTPGCPPPPCLTMLPTPLGHLACPSSLLRLLTDFLTFYSQTVSGSSGQLLSPWSATSKASLRSKITLMRLRI